MVNIDKIRELAKRDRRSLSYLVSLLGLSSRTYFNDIEKNGRDIPDKYLRIIADELHTTPEYLRDETDDPSAAPTNADNNVVIVRGRDGSFSEKKLTDEQMKALQAIIDQLPDAPDDL